jgi:hypothetical protein
MRKPPHVFLPNLMPKNTPMTLDKAIRHSEAMPMDIHQPHLPKVSTPFKHPDDQVDPYGKG